MINEFAVIGVKMEGISKRGFGVPFLSEWRRTLSGESVLCGWKILRMQLR